MNEKITGNERSRNKMTKNNRDLTKFIIAILDDSYGINVEAFQTLKSVFRFQLTPELRHILSLVNGCEGRIFLPEDWQQEDN